MHPDDQTVGRRYKCSMKDCKEMTTRAVGKQYVCQAHFLQGYGRLPGMELPGAETDAPLYISKKDKSKAGR